MHTYVENYNAIVELHFHFQVYIVIWIKSLYGSIDFLVQNLIYQHELKFFHYVI